MQTGNFWLEIIKQVSGKGITSQVNTSQATVVQISKVQISRELVRLSHQQSFLSLRAEPAVTNRHMRPIENVPAFTSL